MSRVRIVSGIILLVASLIMGGCIGNPPDPSPSPDGAVGADGFQVAFGEVTVTGPANVAPLGTAVHLKASSSPAPSGLLGAESAAPAFDIAMDGGVQPQQPVTVTLDLPSGSKAGHSALVFVTRRSDTGTWEGLPVTVHGNTASVTLQHFSTGWFGWADGIGDWFLEQVKQLLKVGFKKPDCVGKSANVAGRDYSVSGDNDGVFPCTASSHGSVLTSIASNSPFVWRYRPTRGQGTGQQGTSPLELSGILTLAVFDAMANYDYANETVLVPGGKADIKLSSGVTETWTGARVDAGLGLVAVLVGGLDVAAAMATGQSSKTWLDTALKSADKASDVRAAAECMAGVVEGGVDPSGRLGEIGNTVISCAGGLLVKLVGGFVGGVIGTVVAIITSMIGLLVTQVWGLIGEITQQNKVVMHITSRPEPVQPTNRITLGAGAALTLNGVRYGRGGPKEIDAIVRALGQPADTTETSCYGANVTMRRWNGLTVYSLKKRTVLDEGPGTTAEAGGVSGWRWDKRPPAVTITGPEGINLGAKFKQVVAILKAKDYSPWVEGPTVHGLLGDTVSVRIDFNPRNDEAISVSSGICEDR